MDVLGYLSYRSCNQRRQKEVAERLDEIIGHKGFYLCLYILP